MFTFGRGNNEESPTQPLRQMTEWGGGGGEIMEQEGK